MTEQEKKDAALIEQAKNACAAKFNEMMSASDFQSRIEGAGLIKQAIEITKKMAEAKTVEAVESVKTEVEALKTSITNLSAKLEQKGKKVNKGAKSLEEVFMKGLADLHKRGSIEKFKRGDIQNLKVTPALFDASGNKVQYKVDNPMSDTTSVIPIGTGGSLPFSITQFEPGLTRVTRRKPFIIELIDFARTMDRYISWVEQQNIDTGVAFTILEGGSASSDYGSFRWVEEGTTVQQIVALSKVTKVMLDDLQETQRQVQEEILELLHLKLDSQILFGNGVSPQLNGIIPQAQAFVNAGNLSVSTPNNYDVLMAAILQIQINGVKSGIAAGGELIYLFEPTDIVLHPADVKQMQLTKDNFNRYVLDQMTYPGISDGIIKMIDGLRITENVGMTQGSFLVMDAKKSHVRMREDAELTLGYNNTDFQDGLVTFRGTIRAAHFIKTIETRAFVSDTFANGQAALAPKP